MDKVILHCDLNNFYASVECLHNPDIRNKPVAVCGSGELRHGVVLAKNQIAKQYGVTTGEVIWEAKKKCADLITLPADFKLYLRFSELTRNILKDYSDQIEGFGIDESWLDITGRDGQKTADEIRERIKDELGITASVGVSWNKIFAKLGSDLRKPDATTVISRENYKNTVFNQSAEKLLGVGRQTKKRLEKYNILTIGELAATDLEFLKSRLGKCGEYLWTFANGYDTSPVLKSSDNILCKSVGNSSTARRDLKNLSDVKMMFTILSESVAQRLREQWLKGRVVSIYIRDCYLQVFSKQIKLDRATFMSQEIIDTALRLFESYEFKLPIRTLGVTVSDLCSADMPMQTDIIMSESIRIKKEKLELAVDEIRKRFGHFSINRAIEYLDKGLTSVNPKEENVIRPDSYF